jgi:hypothetical protein
MRGAAKTATTTNCRSPFRGRARVVVSCQQQPYRSAQQIGSSSEQQQPIISTCAMHVHVVVGTLLLRGRGIGTRAAAADCLLY